MKNYIKKITNKYLMNREIQFNKFQNKLKNNFIKKSNYCKIKF